jgi:hypothetical protein
MSSQAGQCLVKLCFPALAARARLVSVWTATEHPSPTALHVIVAHDLDAVEQKIIEAELAS